VVGVQFKFNGANFGTEDTTAPYGLTWNTTATANGSHVISAVARDAAGNTKTSTGVTVTVQNSVTTSGNHLYVATTGSDSNSGTQAAPFKTILKASQVAVAGTTVHVAPGTYNIGTAGFTTSKSGTASAHIKYVSDTKWGAKLVGSGTEILWTNSGNYIEVNGFDISTTGRLGFYSTGSYGSIYNCYVHDVMVSGGDSGSGGAGIDVLGSNWIIRNNVVRNVDVARVSTRVHGIYLASANNLVYNNLIAAVGGQGINTWHGATTNTIINNTIVNTRYGIVVGSGDSGALPNGDQYNYVANNILANNFAGGIYECCSTGATSYNTYRNNLLYNNPVNVMNATGDVVSGTITTNPLFVNYQANGSGNYHLQSTSPAINTGISTNAPATDLDGIARPQGAGFDIGAYER
jgi:hypothetical protein